MQEKKINVKELARIIEVSEKTIQRNVVEKHLKHSVNNYGGFIFNQKEAEEATNILKNNEIDKVKAYFEKTEGKKENVKESNENEKTAKINDVATSRESRDTSRDTHDNLIKILEKQLDDKQKVIDSLLKTNENLVLANATLTAKLASIEDKQQKQAPQEEIIINAETPQEEKKKGFFSFLRRNKNK